MRKPGRPPIQDQFTALPIGYSRKAQMRHVALGLCMLCRRKRHGKSTRCALHLRRARTYARVRAAAAGRQGEQLMHAILSDAVRMPSTNSHNSLDTSKANL